MSADAAQARSRLVVLLFAATREAAGGCERLELELAPGETVGDVLAALVRRFPGLARHCESLRVAVNEQYVELDHPLRGGDEVALIPPVCGG